MLKSKKYIKSNIDHQGSQFDDDKNDLDIDNNFVILLEDSVSFAEEKSNCDFTEPLLTTTMKKYWRVKRFVKIYGKKPHL